MLFNQSMLFHNVSLAKVERTFTDICSRLFVTTRKIILKSHVR